VVDITDDVVVVKVEKDTLALPADYPADWPPPKAGETLYSIRVVELPLNSDEAKKVIELYVKSNLDAVDLAAIAELERIDLHIDYARKFFKDSSHSTAFKILRVSVICDYGRKKTYDAYKAKVEATYDGKDEPEETVFHGTNLDIADKIIKGKFNILYAANQAHGPGMYFDTRGPLSQYHAYEKATSSSPPCVFVCDMATGNVCRWSSRMKSLPPGCHCGASGDDRQAWMRITTDDAQVYPRYLLELERET
jgi:hypothetical protein